MSDEKKVIRCAVACHNGAGEPDIWFVKVKVDMERLDEGPHYDAAIKHAAEHGMEEPMVAFDELDHAGAYLCGDESSAAEWDSMSVVEI